MSHGRDLALARFIDFPREILVAFGIKLVGGMISYRGQSLDYRAFDWCGFDRRWLSRGGLRRR
jgi:hypothetical protein